MGDTLLPLWLRGANRRMSHAIGKAEMGTHFAEGAGVVVSFDLGAIGEMWQSFLDSPEPNRLVSEAPTKLGQ